MAKLDVPKNGELCEECLLIDKNRKAAAEKVIVLAGKTRIPLCKTHREELQDDVAADAIAES